ncbi:MAG: hypothetical protein P8M78_15380 [Myxococcota bacterium]|nr:hypothetical protein [Myxococcota bacterium]
MPQTSRWTELPFRRLMTVDSADSIAYRPNAYELPFRDQDVGVHT